MMKLKILPIITLLSASLFAQPAHTEQTFANSGGDAVSIDKEWAVVGDANNNAVHVYKLDYSNFQWNGWNAPAAPKPGRFGASVAVHGNKMVVGAPDVETWRMEANTITIGDTYANPNFTTITLQRTYEQPPLIFALASNQGGDPAAVKIRNRTNNSFEIVHNEPPNEDGPHIAMDVFYLAIEQGDHVLPDGTRIYAGEIQTQKVRYDTSRFSNGDTVGWETISFPVPFQARPMVLAQVQTMNSETNNVPSEPSSPWLTAAVQNVKTSSIELSLERSEVVSGQPLVTNPETIAYLVMDVANGAFNDINNNTISFDTLYSNAVIDGWDNGCDDISFSKPFAGTPLVVATKNTLNGVDGGWLRRCHLTNTSIGLTVDEDRFNDTERGHIQESAGIVAFSEPFQAIFKQGEAYLYEYNTVTTDWDLKETIEPTEFSNNMQFGSSVALYDDGSITKIAVGAPDTNNANLGALGRGAVFAYTFDGTTVVSKETRFPANQYADQFGEAIDMKGDYLIVGSPDENGSNGSLQRSGAARVYKFNGTKWDFYPDISHYILTEAVSTNDNRFGSKVAINKDGNISAIASSADYSYYYTLTGGSWADSLAVDTRYDGGVDIDDGILLMIQAGGHVHYDLKADGSDRPISFFNNNYLMHEATLYKEQTIVSDKANSRAAIFSVPCGIKPTNLIANEWSIVSVPCGDGTAAPQDIFGDDIGGSYGDNGNWVMYENGLNYTGKSADYTLTDANQPMVLGKGYWIIADHNVTLKADGDASAGTGITTYTPLDLGKINPDTYKVGGYYYHTLPDTSTGIERKIIVGNASPRPFKWRHLRIYTPNGSSYELGALGVYNPIGYVYDTTQTGQPYRAITATGTPGISDEVKPYEGVWIKQNSQTSDFQGIQLALPFEK